MLEAPGCRWSERSIRCIPLNPLRRRPGFRHRCARDPGLLCGPLRLRRLCCQQPAPLAPIARLPPRLLPPAAAGQIAALPANLLPGAGLAVGEGITARRAAKLVRSRSVPIRGPAAMLRVVLPSDRLHFQRDCHHRELAESRPRFPPPHVIAVAATDVVAVATVNVRVAVEIIVVG